MNGTIYVTLEALVNSENHVDQIHECYGNTLNDFPVFYQITFQESVSKVFLCSNEIVNYYLRIRIL